MSRDVNEIRLTDEELARIRPVTLSVIGPTNEGKTSVLRTLTGDPNFGEVNSLSGTTVRPEYIKIDYKKRVDIIELIDTPGFQMSGAILDRLGTATGAAAIFRSIPNPEKDGDFRHDYRAWEQVAQSDMVIYIANVAESPGQSLLRDTLELLFRVDKPVIVLFNNIASAGTGISALGGAGGRRGGDFSVEWNAALAAGGLHLSQTFDAHRRRFEDEYALFEKICALVRDPLSRKAIRAEQYERLRNERQNVARSRQIIAELLFDIATLSTTAEDVSPKAEKEAVTRLEDQLKDAVAGHEFAAHKELLSVWKFNSGILDRKMLPISREVSEKDSRLGRILKRSGKGAAVGAGIGFFLDVALAGLSLGTGTLIGGLFGGALGGGGSFYHSYNKKTKRLTVRVSPSVYKALLARSVRLTQMLRERGQATGDSIQLLLSGDPGKIDAPKFFRLLDEMAHPAAKLGGLLPQKPQREDERLEQLAVTLIDVLPTPDGFSA